MINFDYNNYEKLVGKAINIDAQQAAERNETLINKADFVRAVSSVEPQKFATDKPVLRHLKKSLGRGRGRDRGRLVQNHGNRSYQPNHQSNNRPNKDVTCGFCGRQGHENDRCFLLHPELKDGNRNAVKCCFCNSPFHVGKNCSYHGDRGSRQSQGNA